LAHGEASAGVLEVDGRMRDVVAVGERQGRDASVRSPLAAHQPRDRGAVLARRRPGEGHEPVAARDVVLPAAPGDRVAVTHEEAVAEVVRGGRVRYAGRAVEERGGALGAGVRDVGGGGAVYGRGGRRWR